ARICDSFGTGKRRLLPLSKFSPPFVFSIKRNLYIVRQCVTVEGEKLHSKEVWWVTDTPRRVYVAIQFQP
ncbi:hypothetical protein VIGAN_02203800, partial [Vigna angularis var. angularis]